MWLLIIPLSRELVLPLGILTGDKVIGWSPALLELMGTKTTKRFNASPITKHKVYWTTEKCVVLPASHIIDSYHEAQQLSKMLPWRKNIWKDAILWTPMFVIGQRRQYFLLESGYKEKQMTKAFDFMCVVFIKLAKNPWRAGWEFVGTVK